jgi:hypothetical protein
MDIAAIAPLVGIFGIVISALFGSLGYFFKVRAERKKALRMCCSIF